MKEKRAQLLKCLWEEHPKLYVHDVGSKLAGHEESWPLSLEVLQWICASLPENATTLETGCGYSTITFAICEANHTAVSPANQQHTRILQWCEVNGMSRKTLRLIDSCSQDILPGMNLEPLDLVLIDGCHAFPAPYLDWYYTAEKIKEGGFLIVDDCQLITGRVLVEFLELDIDRWRVHERIGKTVILQKITSGRVAVGMEWTDQPYCSKSISFPKPTFLSRVLNKAKRALGRFA